MSALRDLDPNARDQVTGMLMKHAMTLLSHHGTAAFAMPRPLAVRHETGHAIIGSADGVTVKRIEVFSQTVLQLFKAEHGRNMRRIERGRLIAAGYSLTTKNWGGWTTWGDNPFATKTAGNVADMAKVEPQVFDHAVRMRLGGICGEHVLGDGNVPEGSSLDEVVVAQAICLDRTGSHASARDLFNSLWRQTCAIIKRNEATARLLIAAFEHADIVDGDALQAILEQVQ
jgi:hypothetical protein